MLGFNSGLWFDLEAFKYCFEIWMYAWVRTVSWWYLWGRFGWLSGFSLHMTSSRSGTQLHQITPKIAFERMRFHFKTFWVDFEIHMYSSLLSLLWVAQKCINVIRSKLFNGWMEWFESERRFGYILCSFFWKLSWKIMIAVARNRMFILRNYSSILSCYSLVSNCGWIFDVVGVWKCVEWTRF